ncbi:MAG: MFS transporter [Planctomycetota bacterium]|jgi:MFS family permease
MTTGVFHGWKLVGALTAILFFAAGGSIYVFPVFIGSFQEEFGWSMTQISGGAAIFAVVMGLSNPVVGALFARFGARRTMLTAAALLALTSLGYALLLDLWMLYAILLVAGFAVAGSTVLPAQTLVTNWFNRFRGLAMGLTMLGIGAGGLVLPPFNELLIRLLGWRLTWGVSCGLTLLIVIPLIAIFVRTRPSDLGLFPDGANLRDETSEESPPASGLTPRSAVATLTFWLVVGVFVLQLMGVSALNFHFVPLVDQQLGFTPQQAAVFYGLAVGFSIVGRLLFGWLADRWAPTLLLALTLLLAALGPAAIELLFVRLQLREVNLLWLYAVPFGIGTGGNFVVIPVLVGRCFGELHFSKIMGLVMSGSAVGVIVGIPAAGWVFDETGSYEWMLIGCVAGLLVSTLLTVLIRPARHHQQFATEG